MAICGRTQQTIDDTLKELEELGVSTLGVIADVSDIGVVDSLHQRVVDGLGAIDILVNNVGGTRSRDDITGTSLDDFKGTFDLNLFGAFQLMKLAIPHMQAQKWGRIINIASIWGREHGGNISYMSAKAALHRRVQERGQLARQGRRTGQQHRAGLHRPRGRKLGALSERQPPDVVRSFIEQNLPMGRFGWPEPLGRPRCVPRVGAGQPRHGRVHRDRRRAEPLDDLVCHRFSLALGTGSMRAA